MIVWFAGTWWICEVLERFEGWLARCRDSGIGCCRPVKLWPRGADWMTRSLANCSWEGATIERPGGALFRRDMPGVLAANCETGSLSLSSPLADCWCSLDSIICRCCSRTDMLRWSCSFMTGSWVTNPGDRQAMPTSWMPRPSRAVNGRAVAGWFDFVFVFLERSSLLGRGRVLVITGDAGSFLTKILGGAPPFRGLRNRESS